MKTDMQPTSLKAYFEEIRPTLPPRHIEIVNIFRADPGMDFTNNELLQELRLTDPMREINTVTPRVYELRGKGRNNPFKDRPLIIESRKRLCRYTRRKAIAWQLTNK